MSAATTYDEGLAALRAKYDAAFLELAQRQHAEKQRLDEVFLPEIKIVGIPCRALTLADELSLRKLNNPMFAGVNDRNQEISDWAMCVHFFEHQMREPQKRWWRTARWKRKQSARFNLQLERLRKMAPKFEQLLCGEVRGYLNSIHGEKMQTGGKPSRGVQLPISPITGIIHKLGKAYGWTADYIVDLPVGFVNQLLLFISTEAALEHGDKPQFPNNEKGRLTSAFLDELNILNRGGRG